MNVWFVRDVVVCLLLACAPTVAIAQSSYPMLMSLDPVAAQVGQSSEHTVRSRYSMQGAYQVLVSGAGVTAEIMPMETNKNDKDAKAKGEELKVRFTLAADARPGVRDFRIVTPRGASTLLQLVVVRDPVVREAGTNDSRQQAQPITLPASICGSLEKVEDMDCFHFRAEAGSELAFHVRSMRLQDKIHDLQEHVDPLLMLWHASGRQLAMSDNEFAGDPFLSHRFEEAGEYVLEIRDVRYKGNPSWQYCIEASDQSPVVPTFPLEVASDLPPLMETEDAVDVPSGVGELSIPVGISGRLAKAGDVDCYAFTAKKGERFRWEVVAHRGESSLDSHLRILDVDGTQLAQNDDMRIGKRTCADSCLEDWAAPHDGKFVIEIRDLQRRGGNRFAYLIRATHSQPHFLLYADTDKTQVTPGLCGAIFVRAERASGFGSEVQLHVDNLPAGVTAHCGRILTTGEDGVIVLESLADAPLGASNVVISGSEVQAPTQEGTGSRSDPATVVATPYQETYLPGGGRGHWPVEMHTVTVGAPGDIRKVELSTYDVVLEPGGSQRMDVRIERAEGLQENVLLDVIHQHLGTVYGSSLPPGISLEASLSKTLLTGGSTEGHITLKADTSAPPTDRQQIAVLANVSINFVMKATYASRPVFVTVKGR